MTLLRYVGSADSVYVSALDRVVLAGDPVDVDDDLAVSLLEQSDNWQSAPAAKPTKPAPVADNSEE